MRSRAGLAVALVGLMWLGNTAPLHAGIDPQVKTWIEQLASDDAEVRAGAGRRLLAIGPAAVAPVLEAAASRNIVLAEPAKQLLPLFGPEAIHALLMAGNRDFTTGKDRWSLAEEAVARMGAAALPGVMELFLTQNPAGSGWAFAIGVLYRMDGLAVEPLLPLLKHPNEKVRQRAASLLAGFGDPRAYEALVDGLRSEDTGVRMYSAMGLGKIGDRRAVGMLLVALDDPNPGTQAAAAGALGRMWEHSFLRPVARLARSGPNSRTRDTAAGVLMDRINDPVAVRIGRRYKPIALSPGRRNAIEFGYLLRLGATAVALLLVGLIGQVGVQRGTPWERWLALAVTACLAVALGYFWGCVVEHLEAMVESMLLFMFVPGVLLVGWLLGEPGGAPFRLTAKRWAWLWTAGSFYAGYGVGWLVLWGHLGA